MEYQKRIMDRFDKLVEDYGFRVIDAYRSIDEIFADLKGQISETLNADREAAGDPIARVELSRNGRSTQEIPRNESRESNLRNVADKPSEDRAVDLRRHEFGLVA